MFKYVVSWANENETRHTIGVEEVDLAVCFFLELLRKGFNVDIVSGITGEVFVYYMNGDNYIADDWEIMLADFLMREALGE